MDGQRGTLNTLANVQIKEIIEKTVDQIHGSYCQLGPTSPK